MRHAVCLCTFKCFTECKMNSANMKAQYFHLHYWIDATVGCNDDGGQIKIYSNNNDGKSRGKKILFLNVQVLGHACSLYNVRISRNTFHWSTKALEHSIEGLKWRPYVCQKHPHLFLAKIHLSNGSIHAAANGAYRSKFKVVSCIVEHWKCEPKNKYFPFFSGCVYNTFNWNPYGSKPRLFTGIHFRCAITWTM